MRTRDMIRAARKAGASAGKNAASWTQHDSNADAAWYESTLRGLNDGDPEVLDAFNVPNLSGEWANDPTPQTLADDYGIDADNDPDGWRLDAVCQAWEDAALLAFWSELERICRFYTEDASNV